MQNSCLQGNHIAGYLASGVGRALRTSQQELIHTMAGFLENVCPESIILIPCKALTNFYSTMSTLDMISLRSIYSSKRAEPDSLCITCAPFFHYLNSTNIIAVRYEPFRWTVWLVARHPAYQLTQLKRLRLIDVESMLSTPTSSRTILGLLATIAAEEKTNLFLQSDDFKSYAKLSSKSLYPVL